MAKTYRKSESFEVLKTVKDYKDNLTTYQWLNTLDFFIEEAVKPLAFALPTLTKNFLALVAAKQVINSHTRYCRGEKQSLVINIFNFLCTEKVEYLSAITVNRGIWFGFFSLAQGTVEPYMSVMSNPAQYSQYLVAKDWEQKRPIWQFIKQSQYWQDKASWFKSIIVQKFTRLALNRAKASYTAIGHIVDLDDIISVNLQFVNKAVERCDTNKGTLATFVNTWLYSANAEVKKLISKNEMSLNDELLVADQSVSWEMERSMSAIAKEVDKEGYVRAVLGIPEYFTAVDYQVLQKAAKVS